MTNLQLFLSIGLPMLFNGLLFMMLNTQITELREDMCAGFQQVEARFDRMGKLFDAKLSPKNLPSSEG